MISPRHREGRLRRLGAHVALVAACHLAVPATVFAQAGKPTGKTSTASLVQKASGLFEDQQYEESIQTLSAALVRPGATEAERIEIYRLLAYNYIILKRVDEADGATRAIFVLRESFALPPTESPRLRDFFEASKKKWIEEGKPGQSVGEAPAAEHPIVMKHSSPSQAPAGSVVKLTGSIEDADGRVRGVQLAYRTGAKAKFVTVSSTYTLGEFHAQIPREAVKPPLIEYYLQAVDKSGLPIASRGDAAAPLRVVVPSEGGVLTSPFFWVPVGVAVVGGAVLAAVLVTKSKGTSTITVGVRE